MKRGNAPLCQRIRSEREPPRVDGLGKSEGIGLLRRPAAWMFATDEQAREWLEPVIWPDSPVCPSCGSTRVTDNPGASFEMNASEQGPPQAILGEARHHHDELPALTRRLGVDGPQILYQHSWYLGEAPSPRVGLHTEVGLVCRPPPA